MRIHKLALFTVALLATSCSSCDEEEPAPPSTPLSEICPAELPPPQDCSIPEIETIIGKPVLLITETEQFKPICSSPCTKGDSFGINLRSNLREPLNTGNLKKLGSLRIQEDDQNTHIYGFENLETIASFSIRSKNVKKLGPFPRLVDMDIFTIQNCFNLEEFTEPLLVEDMSTFGHEILINGNPKLKNLKGLSNLKRIHHLQIVANRGPGTFSTLEGLDNLEFAENLTITGNGNLTSLRALKKLKQVPNRLEFQSNNNLPKCEIDWLLAQLEARPKEVIIMANGPDDVSCLP